MRSIEAQYTLNPKDLEEIMNAPKYEVIFADGYWAAGGDTFTGLPVALGSWDGVEDAEDEGIAFYLDGAEPVGQHGDIVITKVY